ncbi:hypothetical protein VSO52_19360 [Pseudomonas fulva]|uniref:hypothetical protein n=1 Tax=Pseudomonas fulva TaxID=47880 RepID=UPI002DBF1A54|nr:hypothetical protein [Pseudomonas fulva]MEC4024922.1 hypothetical protein [Pseudomonas fulva]
MAIDYRRAFFGVCTGIIAVWCGIKGQSLIHDSESARSMITDVFAILAGFLMTVLTLLMEPKVDAKVWRGTEARKSNFINRIIRYKWLFMSYLLVLGMIFVDNLIIDSKKPDLLPISVYIEYVYLSLATYAFIVSLTLPNRLMELQVDRYEEVVNEQRKGKG